MPFLQVCDTPNVPLAAHPATAERILHSLRDERKAAE